MTTDKVLPLSAEEKADAEKHHDLIYGALHQFGYDTDNQIEEYYDIAALAFLKAIQSYHRQPGLSDRCALSTVCYSNIRRDISHYHESMTRLKRKPENPLIYLDDEGECETALYDVIDSGYRIEDDALDNVEYSDIFAKFTEQQSRIVRMKMEGYQHEEIRQELKISQRRFYKELIVIKGIITTA